MALIEASLLKNKFRGCLVGVLLGDCLGGPFEGDVYRPSGKLIAQKYLDFLDNNADVPYKHYSDDYAMTKAVAQALIEKQPVDYENIAKNLVLEYSNKPTRGYEPTTIGVFTSLKNTNFREIFGPAKTILSGKGFMGGGGASRVSPIAMFYHKDFTTMLEVVKNTTAITHADLLGIHGAMLQSMAIQQSLLIPSDHQLVVEDFGRNLIEKIKLVEDIETNPAADHPFTNQLTTMMQILREKPSDQQTQDIAVVKYLGTSQDALQSVPTAIFCFLRAQTGIERVKGRNPSMAAVQYVLSLGGATDIIASLTGAIAGAYSGEIVFGEKIKKHLELCEDAERLADLLLEVFWKSNSVSQSAVGAQPQPPSKPSPLLS